MWFSEKSLDRNILVDILGVVWLFFFLKFPDNLLFIHLIQNFEIVSEKLALLCCRRSRQLGPLPQDGSLSLQLNSPFGFSILTLDKRLMHQLLFFLFLKLLSSILSNLLLGLPQISWYILWAIYFNQIWILFDHITIDTDNWCQSSIWTQNCKRRLKAGIHWLICILFCKSSILLGFAILQVNESLYPLLKLASR